MKILNLFAGLGGNRALWGDDHEITAVEIKKDVAAAYGARFPKDNVIVGDAYEYLTNNFESFNFIWASPPCPSHSRVRFVYSSPSDYQQMRPILPDLRLYELILFLKYYCKGTTSAPQKWAVENVLPYYQPLIHPQAELGRHLIWSNFPISALGGTEEKAVNRVLINKGRYGFDVSHLTFEDRKDQLLRNCVDPKIGLHVLKCAQGVGQRRLL